MDKIIILYSTTDGHTLNICQKLKTVIQSHNQHVTLQAIEKNMNIGLATFDKILIGASIHYGKHHRLVYDFINQYKNTLNTKPSAFFSVNLVARKPGKNKPDTNPYLLKFLRQISWKPKDLAVFAGKLDYQRYSFLDKFMIRMIMWITKGPTDINTVVEFTDWNQVEIFGHYIAQK